MITRFFIEDSEEVVLNGATHRPHCWFHYMDEIFIIQSHGPDKLKEFLDRLNSVHQNIHFTMEMERSDCLPFLDMHIYRRPDSFLGHKV
jgi:hypothetical protein